jgi:hypothetical protein
MGVIIGNKVQNVVSWCNDNISEQRYWLPSNRNIAIGGAGWEVRSTGTNIDLYCEDEALGTFLALKLGTTVRVFPYRQIYSVDFGYK